MENKIIHFRRTFLPRTESFILEQIKNGSCKPIILTRQIENKEFWIRILDIPAGVYPERIAKDLFLGMTIPIFSYIDAEKNIFKKIWSNLNYKIRRITKSEQKYFLKTILESGAKLIHIHFGPDAGYFLPVIKKTNLPLVVSFYGYDYSRFPKKFFGWGKRYLRKIFKQADCVISISEDMKNDLIALGCPCEKIAIHNWGVDLEKFTAGGCGNCHSELAKNPVVLHPNFRDPSLVAQDDTLDNHTTQNNNFDFLPETNFLSIGRLTAKKGFATLIKAFHIAKRTLPQAKLVIAGEGKERKNLENLIKELSLENDVNLAGFIPQEEISNLIKTCDIYIQPSIQAPNGDKEGFPTTLMEVLASGKPIITTPHAGIEEFIKDDIHGLLVEENNIEVLNDEMVQLANDKNLQKTLSENARKLAEEKFDTIKQNEKLAEIYQNIIVCHPELVSGSHVGLSLREGYCRRGNLGMLNQVQHDNCVIQNNKPKRIGKKILTLVATLLIFILSICFVLTRKSYSINFSKIPYFKKWVSIFEPSPIFFEDDFQKGMGYTTYWNGNYSTAESDKSLEDLAATGTEWISLVVTQYQENIDSLEIKPSAGRRTVSDADLIHVIEKAHSLGIKVALKPHIGLNNDPQHWWGEIGTNFDEKEWEQWFTSYREFMTHYADLAAARGAEQFYIGNEMRATNIQEKEWRELADIARMHYQGTLVYSEGWRGIQDITWWDAVDYIGVNAYYVLADNNEPTVAEMKNTLRKRVSELATLSDKFNRKIIFSEIGYLSIDGVAKNPANWAMAKNQNIPTDYQEQADCYQTFIETFWDEPWLEGIYWWNWDTKADLRSQQDPKYKIDVPLERNYTPQNKPAENIIRNMEIVKNGFTLSPKILYTKLWLKLKELNSYNP